MRNTCYWRNLLGSRSFNMGKLDIIVDFCIIQEKRENTFYSTKMRSDIQKSFILISSSLDCVYGIHLQLSLLPCVELFFNVYGKQVQFFFTLSASDCEYKF